MTAATASPTKRTISVDSAQCVRPGALAVDPQKKFFVAYETTSEALVITITDQGKGLDPCSIPDPLAPENLMKGSGRGIFLIRAFMDEVKFRNMEPGTEITLIKHVGRKTANAKEETQ